MSKKLQAPAGFDRTGDTPLRQALRICRNQFLVVGVFSGIVNLLQLTTSIYMMQVFDRVLATRSIDTLLYLSLMAIGAALVLALLDAVRGKVMQALGSWVENRVAPEAFVRAIESSLRGAPYRMEALRDIASLRSYLASPSALSLYDVPWVPIYIAVIFALHWVLGLIALGGAILLFGLALASELATAALVKQANTASIYAQRRADGIARNAEVIDSMGMLPAVITHWRSAMARMVEPQQRAANRAAVVVGATRFFRLCVQIGVLGTGIWLALSHDLTAGAAVAGSIILGRALAPLEQMISGWKQLVQTRQAFRRLEEFLKLTRLRPPGRPLPAPTGRLSVERATFAFPGQGVPLLRGISFELAAGESLAIIGPSAAGKTTLVRLLTGTLEPLSGTVRLDGADVYQWLREDFGSYLGYLPQDVELFDGTVFTNIARMGEATPEEVYDAARLAGCHDMILRLPDGYDTEIGEGGLYLSGGQRQLIGLARAMFGRPRLVVLDEPNSNLDGASEAALMRALEQLKALETTVVLVSHRPSLVQGVDKILQMRDGSIEVFGPRTEVLKRMMAPPRPVPAAPVPRRETRAVGDVA
ncbi:MAG: type I secretion system permease/ATPase [Proteobacteria bacterium]|nr:type I secretion system permease/ATPase [Pseudomonadota bacterium]